MFEKTMRMAKQCCFQINYKFFTILPFLFTPVFFCVIQGLFPFCLVFFFFFWWESYRIITPFGFACGKTWVSLVAQLVKNPPAMQTQVQSMDGEDPQEKGMATHSSILA